MSTYQHRLSPLLLTFVALVLVGCATAPDVGFSYPDARRGELVETLHGQQVAAPYRWMEADSSEPELRQWIEDQNEVTEGYLSQSPHRERIRARLTELWDYPRYSVPQRRGDRYFWTFNTGLQAQSVLMTGPDPSAAGEVLLDPNTFSDDGTVALSGTWPNKDGSLLAYATSEGGSDWKTIHVMETATGSSGPGTTG